MRTKTAAALGLGLAGIGAVLTAAAAGVPGVPGKVIFETTSPYHHIQVVDDAQGLRTLTFDGSWESQMYVTNPLSGHFEYTELFQLTWLWNSRMSNVLVMGLGGASTQRSYEHYYPDLSIETAELDPAVLRVAKDYFHFKESPQQQVHLEDGRIFLRRSLAKYDAILMDAYTTGPYGSAIPPHLVTKEFFEIAASHLRTNGVLAYNVIGTLRGYRADLLGALYKTLNSVFPEVYVFPARTSQNVVLIATRSSEKADYRALQQRANALIRDGRVTLPTFRTRLSVFRSGPPPTVASAPLLTDDYAPVESLMNSGGQ